MDTIETPKTKEVAKLPNGEPCPTCEAWNGFGPTHVSPLGHRPHCACDGCY